MKWHKGIILFSGQGSNCNALIQHLEGRWDLHIQVQYNDGRISTKDGISDWSEAERWCESVDGQ